MEYENLRIDSVVPFSSEQTAGVIIYWSSDDGFGEYTLYTNAEGQWCANAERKETKEDRSFGLALLKLWLEQSILEG